MDESVSFGHAPAAGAEEQRQAAPRGRAHVGEGASIAWFLVIPIFIALTVLAVNVISLSTFRP